MSVIIVGSIVVVLVGAYIIWLRPILKQTPALHELFATEDTFFAAMRVKFAGIKQKLTGALVIIAGVIVELHDQLAPIIAGVDTTSLSQQVPSWVWPLIVIAIAWALQWFRRLAEKRGDL
jgi:hypothetical protein